MCIISAPSAVVLLLIVLIYERKLLRFAYVDAWCNNATDDAVWCVFCDAAENAYWASRVADATAQSAWSTASTCCTPGLPFHCLCQLQNVFDTVRSNLIIVAMSRSFRVYTTIDFSVYKVNQWTCHTMNSSHAEIQVRIRLSVMVCWSQCDEFIFKWYWLVTKSPCDAFIGIDIVALPYYVYTG